MIRAIIVDDEPLARRGIRARLDRAGGYTVVAECASGREAIAAIREHAPNVVFLDVQTVSYTHLTLPTNREV